MGAYLTLVLSLSAAALAQTASAGTADATRYAVGYVEVKASAASALRAAFNQYRDASRHDDGFIDVLLLEQSGKAGSFVVVGTWRDQAAVDAHAKAASRMKFLDALAPIRVSGYDERPYKNFAVRSANATASRGAVWVVTHADIGPPGDATGLLRMLAEDSHAEPGCLRFDVLQHAARANHFTIIEAWSSQQARDVHAAATHTRQYRDQLQPLIGSPLDERLMR